jgi:hypothetical protein
MSNTFGIESHHKHVDVAHRPPTRYLVLIDSAGSVVARLFTQNRDQVAEFDGAAEEVAVMTKGLVPMIGALGAEWDGALQGHNTAERTGAEVFTLDL